MCVSLKKLFYNTECQRRSNQLPRDPNEQEGIYSVMPFQLLSRHFLVKVILMGVIAPLLPEVDFGRTIFLKVYQRKWCGRRQDTISFFNDDVLKAKLMRGIYGGGTYFMTTHLPCLK